MSDKKQRRTRGVPWADHTAPSSEGASNPADRSARIDPDELEDVEVSPGKLAASSSATPTERKGGGRAPDQSGRGHSGKRDVGKGSLRADHLREDHKTE